MQWTSAYERTKSVIDVESAKGGFLIVLNSVPDTVYETCGAWTEIDFA